MMTKLKITIIVIIGFVVFISSNFLSAIDAPHNGSNDINCGSCHGQTVLLNSPFWTNSGDYDRICTDICHFPQSSCPYTPVSAPRVQTHSDSSGNSLAECLTCHEPHYQKQINYKNTDANNLYLAKGTITSCSYIPPDPEEGETVGKSTLTYSPPIIYKAGWNATKLIGKTETCRHAILFPNVNKLGYSYPITGIDESENKITVKGDARPVYQYISSSNFAVTYSQYIKDVINDHPVKFFDQTGKNSFTDSYTTYNGVCEVCHTETRHFQSNGLAPNQLHSVDQNGKPAKVGAGNDCTMCHKHENGFAVNMPSHSATPGSDWVMVFEDGTHDSAMIGDAEVEAECQMCHNTKLSDAHDYQCLLCHPSPAGTVVGSWGGGCQQGGCHATIHEDVSAAHNAVADDYPDEWDYCTQCHEYPNPPGNWTPTSAACPNCHAVYNPADTTPPVTTSNAKASYLGPARIEYTVRDSGKVVVAQSYSSVDDGPAVMGSSILITETGNHNLKFWSVDQANNTESPPNEVDFEIVQDTTPPVTTSNAKALPYIYYNAARIWFSSSDNGELGVKTTYYSLDGGPTTKGTSVYVSGSVGTFEHTLKFWSEDWSGNVEDSNAPENNVTFTISKGTGTFRMWGGGSSCADDPDPDEYWVIKKDGYNGDIVAQGIDGCDVVLPLSATGYFVMVYWWIYDDPGYYDEYYYPDNLYHLTTNGQVIELDY